MVSDGKQVTDSNGKAVVVKKASDPFFGPYIRNAIRHLLFENVSEFPHLPKTITIPLVAFVCTLVRIQILAAAGMYSYYAPDV